MYILYIYHIYIINIYIYNVIYIHTYVFDAKIVGSPKNHACVFLHFCVLCIMTIDDPQIYLLDFPTADSPRFLHLQK